MGEVVPARTSLTLHRPSPSTVHQLSRQALLRVNHGISPSYYSGCSDSFSRTSWVTEQNPGMSHLALFFRVITRSAYLSWAVTVESPTPCRKTKMGICNHQTDCLWVYCLIRWPVYNDKSWCFSCRRMSWLRPGVIKQLSTQLNFQSKHWYKINVLVSRFISLNQKLTGMNMFELFECNGQPTCFAECSVHVQLQQSYVVFCSSTTYYAPKVQPDRGSNSWPPAHDSTFHVTEMHALATQPSVIA